MKPLISIVIPAYNAEATLPTALASLVAQTYHDWECIIIDDGSEDETAGIGARSARNESRFRYFRLAENRGRGAARQVGLEMASGHFLAMLDADDWVYPDKLERQIDVFRSVPDSILVSTGMAIADENGDLTGVRYLAEPGSSPASRPPIGLGTVPVAFAPSMIEINAAKRTGFDSSLKRSEDRDFLLRLLMKNRHCVLPDLTYVYNELASVDYVNVRDSIRSGMEVIEKYRAQLPGQYWASRLKLNLHLAAYWVFFTFGYGAWIIGRRSAEPTAQERQQYRAAKAIVQSAQETLLC